jgi:hypothetical protein
MLYVLTPAEPKTANVTHTGGTIQVQVSGDFDGATVNLNVSQDLLPEQPLSDFAVTAENTLLVDIVDNAIYNFELATPGAGANISVSVL